MPRMRAHAVERLGEPRDAFEPYVSLCERPRGEVDVRVGEAGQDAAAPEIDDVWCGERGLVRADPARDALTGDREGPRDRQRGVHRADHAVIQDHARRLYRRR